MVIYRTALYLATTVLPCLLPAYCFFLVWKFGSAVLRAFFGQNIQQKARPAKERVCATAHLLKGRFCQSPPWGFLSCRPASVVPPCCLPRVLSACSFSRLARYTPSPINRRTSKNSHANCQSWFIEPPFKWTSRGKKTSFCGKRKFSNRFILLRAWFAVSLHKIGCASAK